MQNSRPGETYPYVVDVLTLCDPWLHQGSDQHLITDLKIWFLSLLWSECQKYNIIEGLKEN